VPHPGFCYHFVIIWKRKKPASSVAGETVKKPVFWRDNHVLPLAHWAPGRQNEQGNRPKRAIRFAGEPAQPESTG
jgi:hypothetical protein